MAKFRKINEQEQGVSKNKIIIMCLFILMGIVALGGTSYAVFSTLVRGNQTVTLQAGVFEIEFQDGDYLKVPALTGMSDSEGKKTKPYRFTIKNTGNMRAVYKISLSDDEAVDGKELLNTEYLRYQITGTDGSSETGKIKGLESFFKGQEKSLDYVEGSNSIDYELRLWLASDVPDSEQGKSYRSKIEVNASQEIHFTDPSGANIPELGDRLIPVVYNTTNNEWEKANTVKDWYNYEEQRWANAVIVDPTKYEAISQNAAGTAIPMTDILQMYVWIPRYSYTIKDQYGKNGTTADNPGEIDVHFIDKNTKEEGTATYSDDSPTGWYTPDAFTLGGKNLSGIWVGKFESGYKDAEDATGAQKNVNEPQNVIIKPNVYSWRVISVSNIYSTVKGIAKDAAFGMSETIYDSHAMKNDEWAAVAYLTQSKYGKYGNSAYEGANKEVYINNYFVSESERNKTGCSGGAPGLAPSKDCIPYNDLESAGAGPGASTTGNIYGVYDMSGGAWEYVMGNYSNEVGSSEFTGDWATQYKDYINFYTTSAVKSHALSETAGWYGDHNTLVYSSYPWMDRGGGYNNAADAGVFYFSRGNGSAYSNYSFRVVLTLNKTSRCFIE